MLGKSKRRSQHHRAEPDPLARTVGARVRSLREEKQFTFDAFVEECGLGRGYVSELERGLVVPTISALAKIARALEVTIADLVLGVSPREQVFETLRNADDVTVLKTLKQIKSELGERMASRAEPHSHKSGPRPV